MSIMYNSMEYKAGHFSYYKNVETKVCKFCQEDTSHLLLRLRTFLIPIFQLVATSNRYFTVCSKCYHLTEIVEEVDIMRHLEKARDTKPIKFHGSEALLDRIDDHVRSPEEIIDATILIHMKDIKKSH